MIENLIEVVNVKTVGGKNADGIKYIGRTGRLGLGNPIVLKRGMDKGSTLPAYKRHLWQLWQDDPDGVVWSNIKAIADEVKAGKEVKLACHCSPFACHGDVIKSAIL